MTQEKTPAATEVTTSAQNSAILAGREVIGKTGQPCYIRVKPKGPVRRNTFGYAVATPTDKRGFVMSEFVRHGVAHAGMVAGKMGLPARMAARRIPCHQHLAHPLRVMTRRVASESRYGAKTMTKVIPLVRAAAPIIAPASRRAAPIQSQADTTDPQIIALHAAAENALASALHLLRSLDCDPAKLQAATGRAIRASALLKRACAASMEGGAA